jgi:hypothetical protein
MTRCKHFKFRFFCSNGPTVCTRTVSVCPSAPDSTMGVSITTETKWIVLEKASMGVGFEVLTAVHMNISVLCDIALCSPFKANWSYGWSCLNFHGRRISQARINMKRVANRLHFAGSHTDLKLLNPSSIVATWKWRELLKWKWHFYLQCKVIH